MYIICAVPVSGTEGYGRNRAPYCTMIEIGHAWAMYGKLGWAPWEHSQHPKPNLAGVYLEKWLVS
jgi:hypothetical protein